MKQGTPIKMFSLRHRKKNVSRKSHAPTKKLGTRQI